METIKLLHISSVGLSFSGFFIRGIWMLLNSNLLHKKITKILPHIIDSVLLSSALLLLYLSPWSVLEQPWLQAKITALVVYIFLGFIAMKAGRAKKVRGGAWLAGLIVFLYIVSVAISKSPLGFVAWF